MLTIDIIDDDDPVNFGVDTVMDEHYHAVMALNRTAEKAREEIKSDLPDRYAIRKNWVQKGIRVDQGRANSLVARVYSVDPYMVKQDEGQDYKPDGHVAIPWAARPSKKALIPRSMLPKALRNRKDVFRFDFSKNANHKPFPLSGIFQRVLGRKHLRVLYLLKDEKHTPATWDFSEQVEDAVDRYFERYYDELDEYDDDDVVTELTRRSR